MDDERGGSMAVKCSACGKVLEDKEKGIDEGYIFDEKTGQVWCPDCHLKEEEVDMDGKDNHD